MRKALTLTLALALTLLGVPVSGVAAENGARGPAAQPPQAGNIAGKITDIKPGQTFTVQVRTLDGTPAMTAEGTTASATVGPTGGFTVTGLVPGTYVLEVTSVVGTTTQTLPLTVTVVAGQTASVTLSAAALGAALAAGATTGGILGMSTTLAAVVIGGSAIVLGTVAFTAAQDEVTSHSR